jgi:hypothetical protein
LPTGALSVDRRPPLPDQKPQPGSSSSSSAGSRSATHLLRAHMHRGVAFSLCHRRSFALGRRSGAVVERKIGQGVEHGNVKRRHPPASAGQTRGCNMAGHSSSMKFYPNNCASWSCEDGSGMAAPKKQPALGCPRVLFLCTRARCCQRVEGHQAHARLEAGNEQRRGAAMGRESTYLNHENGFCSERPQL